MHRVHAIAFTTGRKIGVQMMIIGAMSMKVPRWQQQDDVDSSAG